jgi:transcriptional regulator PpsR
MGFRAPQTSLSALDAEAAGALIASVTDVALVIDADGVIRDCSFQTEELAEELQQGRSWVGRPWLETATVESQPKIRSLLKDAAAGAPGRQRHINHASLSGVDVPVMYSAMRVGRTKNMIACGRDLRTISTLQRRLLDAQHSMERDYTRLRQVETRYRMLFQLSPDPVLIVDAVTQRVVEANPAATLLLETPGARLVDRSFTEVFNAESQLAIQALLAGMRVAARGDEMRARLGDGRRDVTVSAALFRQENATFFLIRLVPLSAEAERAAAAVVARPGFAQMVEHAPDGIVITGGDGAILAANPAFLDMAELAAEEQARGEKLDRWVGRQGVDLDVLMANLRQRGTVRLFATTLHGEFGARLDVELSAAAVDQGPATAFGFTIRNVGRRLGAERKAIMELPRSVEQLTELIGRVSLKELVRESTDMIERLCIEAALEVTGDNRASAAEMLGLSRQSLYVKLRRYGLGELDEEPKP